MAKNRKVKSFDTCQLCLEAPTAPGAHIESKGFFKRIADGQNLHAIPLDPASPVEPGFMGPRDYGIHCGPCETLSQIHDKFAVEALEIEPVTVDARSAALPTVDARKLKLAFMHILWRTHTTMHPAYRAIRLPPQRAERLRALIRAGEVGSNDEFETLLRCHDPEPAAGIVGPLTGIIAPPFVGVFPNRAQTVVFSLGRWQIHVSATDVRLMEELRPFIVTPGELVRVERAGPYQESSMWKDALASAVSRARLGRHQL